MPPQARRKRQLPYMPPAATMLIRFDAIMIRRCRCCYFVVLLAIIAIADATPYTIPHAYRAMIFAAEAPLLRHA